MKARQRRVRIVLTGAWGGGKSTLIRELDRSGPFKGRILALPEAAPLARAAGLRVASPSFQRYVVEMQHAMERAVEYRESSGDHRIVLVHRGSLDALAFWKMAGRSEQEFFYLIESDYDLELAGYDAVILMRSTAGRLPEVYEKYRLSSGRGSAEEALELEKALHLVWERHPRFFVIGETGMTQAENTRLAERIVAAVDRHGCESCVDINRKLDAIQYPSTHQYILDDSKRIVPSQKGRARIEDLLSVLPKREWNSLIDVGCAKGMFLYWALSAFDLKRATGVEPAPDMAEAARLVGEYLNAPAAILHGSLIDVYRAIPPADLVFVFHCYHYLFFGSEGGNPGLADHERLFSILARLCVHTLVFANPLELDDRKKEALRGSGVAEPIIARYHPEAILGGADKYFSINQSTLGGGRPYIVMTRRGACVAGVRVHQE